MITPANDDTKSRLTGRVEIARAILDLAEQGVKQDFLLLELLRKHHVDLDAFNEVLRAA